ncbi:MAG: CRISPR-associated endonuclease Cas2 [Acidimicrobiia bacterium]
MRRRYIVAYDIRDEVRLRRVHDVVRSYGTRLQYSVFLCDLSQVEKIRLWEDLRPVMNQVEDSVMFVDLGEPAGRGTACFEFIGPAPDLPRDGPTIV